MKKNKKILFIICVVLLVPLCVYFANEIYVRNAKDCCAEKPQFFSAKDLISAQDRSLVVLKINDQSFLTEIVNTSESRSQGLSGRDSIDTSFGEQIDTNLSTNIENTKPAMLFIFPKKEKHVFWMKDMQFNLDIIWIADEKIVEISRDVPAPEQNALEATLPRFFPSVPADMVLEVAAGDAVELEVGDKLVYGISNL